MRLILFISILLVSSSVNAQADTTGFKQEYQHSSSDSAKRKKILYNSHLKKGKRFINQKKFVEAKLEFQKALELLPNAQYPKDQIKLIDQLLDEQMASQQSTRYSELIKVADEAFARKRFHEAKEYYTSALAIKPNEQYPKTQIANIISITTGSSDPITEEEYKKIIQAADTKLAAKDFLKAKEYYTRAIAIRPSDPYPKQKLEEIETIFTSQKVESERKTTFNKLISEADSLFTLKRYPEAKNKYTEALALEPSAMYPKQKLQEVSNIMASTDCGGDEKQIKYDKLITEGDYLFKNKSYDQAKFKYQEALQIKATQYPKDKILEIQQINNDTRAKQAEYHKLIKEADTFLLNKYYEQALLKYEEAVKIDPTVNYPKAKISEITAILKEDH